MAKQSYTATEAARELGISVDTLRRWDRAGKLQTVRDERNRRPTWPASRRSSPSGRSSRRRPAILPSSPDTTVTSTPIGSAAAIASAA